MKISVFGRKAIVVASVLGSALWSWPASARDVDCDYNTFVCTTDIIEIHKDSVGRYETGVDYSAPAGVRFRPPGGAVELEAGGAEHFIEIRYIKPNSFTCQVMARKKWFGDNGLEKGYCYINFDIVPIPPH